MKGDAHKFNVFCPALACGCFHARWQLLWEIKCSFSPTLNCSGIYFRPTLRAALKFQPYQSKTWVLWAHLKPLSAQPSRTRGTLAIQLTYLLGSPPHLEEGLVHNCPSGHTHVTSPGVVKVFREKNHDPASQPGEPPRCQTQ